MNNEMTNKKTNIPLFKVKCVDTDGSNLTLGEEYDVVGVEDGFYAIEKDNGVLKSYLQGRFEIVETLIKDKQEYLKVGDKIIVVAESFGYFNLNDILEVVKVDKDDSTATYLASNGSETHWVCNDVIAPYVDDNSLDNNFLSHQEVVQAVIDGKELEMQYKTGTWVNVIPTNTTLHQLTILNFRLKPSLEDKRKAVIKKLLESKVAVLCKCWGDDDIGEDIVAITKVDDDFVYSYMNNDILYQNAYAIDDNGNEITNV